MDEEKSVCIYHAPCPACGSRDNLGVYSDGHSYCFGCQKTFPATEDRKYVAKKKLSDLKLIQGDLLPLGKRRLSQETTRKFGYQCGTYEGQPVQIANYYANGELVAQHLRLPDKSFKWIGDASNIDLFGQQLWRDKGKRVVVTEGEIDCMTVSQAFNNKWQSVSVPNGAASAKKYVARAIEWLENFEEVVFAFDMDEPGRKAAKECAALFTPGKAKIASYPTGFKDVSDMMQAGKDEQVAHAIFEAKVFRPDGILCGTELKEKIVAFFEGGGTFPAFATPYPKMNEMVAGFRKGELVMLTAGTGIGKSTAAFEIAHHFGHAHNLKIGIVALEENTLRSGLRLMSIELNQPLHLSMAGITKEAYDTAFERTVGNGRVYLYDHFGSLESDNLLSKLKYLATGVGCDFIVLDHISIAVSGIEDGDERRIIDNLMTNMRSLVEQTQVGIIAVCHLKKKQGTGATHEEGGRVTLDDLRGSGGIKQMSDTIIGMERDQQDEEMQNVSLLRVLKCRFTGVTGAADTLEYTKKTGRLLPQNDIPAEFRDESQPASPSTPNDF